jgi:hypothetical protein
MDATFGTVLEGELGSRYGRVAGYLSELDEGLASYPECVVHSGVARFVLAAAPEARSEPPPLVEALLDRPRDPWTPEVVVQAMVLAIAARAGMSNARLAAWSRATSAELFRAPLLRTPMAFDSPEALLERAGLRWHGMRRGTELSVEGDGPRGAVFLLRFPPRLFAPTHLHALAEGFAAAIEHARARAAIVEIARASATSAAFVARWS